MEKLVDRCGNAATAPSPYDGASSPPLFRPDALEAALQGLNAVGCPCLAELLRSDYMEQIAFLQRCATEADAVLFGNRAAGTRLWLLLRTPTVYRRPVPPSVLQHAAGERWTEPPVIASGDALLRVVAGVVRGSNQPKEAEQLLIQLAERFKPIFLMEAAAGALEQARQGRGESLKTLATALADETERPAFTPPTDPYDVPGDRVPYDVATWHKRAFKTVFDTKYLGWPCPGGTHKGMSEIDRFGPGYAIDSISNDSACPGQTITLRGRGLGPTGRVYFPSPALNDPASALGTIDNGVLVGVEPTRWTDTEIDVVVPPFATAGDIHLNAFTRHETLCTTIDVYRLGNSIFFRGGLAKVYQISVAGHVIDLTSPAPTNLAPNDSVALSWRSSGGPATQIRIQLLVNGVAVWDRNGLPGGFGAVVLTVPNLTDPTSADLLFTATSPCGQTQPLHVPIWISVPPVLRIAYVEVTQGVQEDLDVVLAGRGMPTVANKDTAVRVHMTCDRQGWFRNKLDRITGSLWVDGRRLYPTNKRPVIPDQGFAGIASSRSDPNFTNETLNFTIPAAWVTPGNHSLKVQVVCADPSGTVSDMSLSSWGWVTRAAFAVRTIEMAYLASSSNETMLDYARRALDYLPTPLTDIGVSSARWFTHSHDLSSKDGMGDLLDDIEDLRDDDDEADGVRWLAIVPSSDITGSTRGISHTPGTVALADSARPEVAAHELGHTLGLNHVNLPLGVPDGPYDSADNGGLLRRPPFDVRNSIAISLPAGDLMTYRTPIRPGISTWMRLYSIF